MEAKKSTGAFVTLFSAPVHRTQSTDVALQIVGINKSLYVGLQRTSYIKDEQQGIEVPRQKSVLLPYQAWEELVKTVAPQVERKIRQLLPLAETARVPLPTKRKFPSLNNGMQPTVPLLLISVVVSIYSAVCSTYSDVHSHFDIGSVSLVRLGNATGSNEGADGGDIRKHVRAGLGGASGVNTIAPAPRPTFGVRTINYGGYADDDGDNAPATRPPPMFGAGSSIATNYGGYPDVADGDTTPTIPLDRCPDAEAKASFTRCFFRGGAAASLVPQAPTDDDDRPSSQGYAAGQRESS